MKGVVILAIHKFIVEETIEEEPKGVGHAMGWWYRADHEKLVFEHASGNGPDDITVEGDFIGKQVMFLADGYNSKFMGEVKAPADPIFRALWEKGFARKSRVFYDEIQRAGSWEQLVDHRCFEEYSSPDHFRDGITSILVDRKSDGSIMIATADGRLPNGKYIKLSYINKYATEDDLDKWRKAYDKDRI